MHAASNFLVIEHLYLQLGPAAGGRMSLRVVLLLRRAMTLGVVLLLPFLQIVNACVSIPASKVVSYADPSSRFQLSIVVAEEIWESSTHVAITFASPPESVDECWGVSEEELHGATLSFKLGALYTEIGCVFHGQYHGYLGSTYAGQICHQPPPSPPSRFLPCSSAKVHWETITNSEWSFDGKTHWGAQVRMFDWSPGRMIRIQFKQSGDGSAPFRLTETYGAEIVELGEGLSNEAAVRLGDGPGKCGKRLGPHDAEGLPQEGGRSLGAQEQDDGEGQGCFSLSATSDETTAHRVPLCLCESLDPFPAVPPPPPPPTPLPPPPPPPPPPRLTSRPPPPGLPPPGLPPEVKDHPVDIAVPNSPPPLLQTYRPPPSLAPSSPTSSFSSSRKHPPSPPSPRAPSPRLSSEPPKLSLLQGIEMILTNDARTRNRWIGIALVIAVSCRLFGFVLKPKYWTCVRRRPERQMRVMPKPRVRKRKGHCLVTSHDAPPGVSTMIEMNSTGTESEGLDLPPAQTDDTDLDAPKDDAYEL